MKSHLLQSPAGHHTIFIHALIFAGVVIAASLAVHLVGTGTWKVHLLILLALLPWSGIPHGALDYALAQRLFEARQINRWRLGFVVTYMGGMAVVLLLWWVFPGASLAAFLVLTLYHFGWDDTLANVDTPLWLRLVEIIGRGTVVLTFPALFFPDDVQLLFAFLSTEAAAQMLIPLLAWAAPLSGLCLLMVSVASVVRYLSQRSVLDLARTIELLCLALLLALVPALLAFAIYFNGLHAVRHMLNVAATDQQPSYKCLQQSFVQALPVTIATFVLAGIAYAFWSGVQIDLTQLVRVIFIGIASMTYPHVVVVWLAEKSTHLKP